MKSIGPPKWPVQASHHSGPQSSAQRVWLGGCRTWSVEAKIGPSEDSFCRICSPIARLWGKKTVKNGPLWPICSRRFPSPTASYAFRRRQYRKYGKTEQRRQESFWGRLAQTHWHKDLVAIALDQQRHRLACGGLGHRSAHLLDVLGGRAVDGQQHIPWLHTGRRSGAARLFDHQALGHAPIRAHFAALLGG